MNAEIIKKSISQFPKIEGPIPVTKESYPFSTMRKARKPLDLSRYGFVEEEYFLEGTANIYEGFDQLGIKSEACSYKTRLLIRKPQADQFSGRVFIDIYNASNGYDIEDIWRRSYQYFLEEGHVYIGITSKPINVLSLKNFDYDRYCTLDWSSPEPAPQPSAVVDMSIPGTEEGLIWDILSQLGYFIRNGNPAFLKDYDVQHIYLTGQSQSAMYLNTYVYFFHEYVKGIFDGYLSVVGTGSMRDLNQYENIGGHFSARDQLIPKNLETPFILLSAHGDINLFGSFDQRLKILKELAQTDEPIRHYELTSSPHTDPASPLIPDNSEIEKTKNPPKILDGEYRYEVNNIQLAYYVNSAFEFLHQWANKGITPPKSLMIERDEKGYPLKDQFGNGLGGLRSPYIDVPIATYHPNAIADQSQIDQSVGNVNGSMDYFDSDQIKALYQNREDYLKQLQEAINEQVREGWLLENDGKRLYDTYSAISKELF